MMKILSMVFSTVVFALCLSASENHSNNLLKNTGCQKFSPAGFPMYWEYRSKVPSPVVISNLDGKTFSVNVTKDASPVVLVQNIDVKSGKYLLSGEIRSNQKSVFQAYCEFTEADAEKRIIYSSFGAKPRISGLTWRHFYEYIEVPDKKIINFYLALIFKKNAQFEIRNLTFSKCVNFELLPNADFSILFDGKQKASFWDLRSDKNCYTFAEKSVVLKSVNQSKVILASHKLVLESNKKYILTYDVSSPSKAKYRIYFEMTDHKNNYTATDTSMRYATADSQKKRIFFTIPQGINKTILAIISEEGGELKICNLQFREMTATDEENEKKNRYSVLGGFWEIEENSKFIKADGHLTLIIKGGKSAVLKDIPMVAGKRYKLSYQVRGTSSKNTTGFAGFKIQIFFDKAQKPLTSPPDDTWNRFQDKSFIFTLPGNMNGKVNIACAGINDSTVELRNFFLEELPPKVEVPVKIILKNPFYRDSIYESVKTSEISGDVLLKFKAKKIKVTLTGGKINLSQKSNHFYFSTEGLPYGKYILTAEAENADGKILKTEKIINKYPPYPNEVVLNENRFFTINGKVFFPVLFWLHSAGWEGDEFAAAFGVNIVRRPAKSEKLVWAELETARKNGIKVIFSVGYAQDNNEEAIKKFQHRLYGIFSEKIRQHPSFFGYFTCDEPRWIGVPSRKLRGAYEALKEFDPYHPVWINAAPRGSINDLAEYGSASDIFGVDIYPVPYPNNHSGLDDKLMTCVGKYSERMWIAGGKKKATWIALQGFSWRSLRNKDNGKGYPTYEELRFMVYDSLLNHGTGISFWGMSHVKTPAFFDVLFKVTKHVHMISGLFADGRLVKKESSAGLLIADYICQRNKYKIILNQTPQHKKFSANAPSFFILPGKNNSDSPLEIAPYGVVILGTAELPEPNYKLPEYSKSSLPFVTTIAEGNQKDVYRGTANWIWDQSSIKSHGIAKLEKSFRIDKKLVKATILAAADDFAEIFINGSKLGDSYTWDEAVIFDITEKVKLGDNKIIIVAEDYGSLPCGFIAEINLFFEDDSVQKIVTDNSWQICGKNENAAIVAPNGQGVWKYKVALPKNDKDFINKKVKENAPKK